MILFGVELPRFALPIAAGAAVTLVALDVFGRHTPPSAWRLPAPVAPECASRPSPNHGANRSPSKLRVIILHSTEGPSVASAAGWFESPSSRVSAHVIVGDDGCVRSLDDLAEAWAAPGTNHDGLHLEIVGRAAWSRDEWLKHPQTLARARAQIRAWAAQYGIPLKMLNAAALKRGERGIATHKTVTDAFSGGSGHFDPGSGFPLDAVVAGNSTPTMGLVGALFG